MIPNLINIGATRSVLPYGRYLVNKEEVERVFVKPGDMNRQEIWKQFIEVLNVVKYIGGFSGVWIGGSFITSEGHPHDVDVVFLMKNDAYESLVNQTPNSDNESKAKLHLFKILFCTDHRECKEPFPLVDRYVLVVFPTEMDYGNEDTSQYLKCRGYWDQFWSKARFGYSDPRWRYPAAGYLQMEVNGYA